MIGMVGVLWYEGDTKKPLDRKIREAIDFYRAKTGKEAKLCLLCTKDAQGTDFSSLSKDVGVIVRAVRIVPPLHLWVGEEDEIKKP